MEAHRRQGKDQEEEEPNVAAVQVSKPAPHLPQEILRDILLRLPARSLQRLKDVCPSWRAIISDTRFIKSHLNQANKGGIVNYLHGISKEVGEDPQPIFRTLINREASETETMKLCYPVNDQADRILVLGSCNGLLLLAILPSLTLLWNTTTGECNTLARDCCDVKSNTGDKVFIYGLGYDSSLDEYKAVLFVVRYEINYEDLYVREVQSDLFICGTCICRNGSWKKVDHDFPYRIDNSTDLGITVNGAPHWVVSDSDQRCLSPYRTIIYFDMADEKFKTIPTPSWWSLNKIYGSVEIGVLEGCLICTIPKDIWAYDNCHFEVWAMKEYGVRESWTMLFAIRMPFVPRSLTPLGFTKNGDEVVLHINGSDGGKLVAYNLNTEEHKFIVSTPSKFGAVYVESLLSPEKEEKNCKHPSLTQRT